MSKVAALTFDDGHSNVTSKILDILENEGIRGTFFLIGNNISEETKPLLERQIKGGHEICNHSMTHSPLADFKAEDIRKEIEETTKKIEALSDGRVTPKFFRPPFLSVSDTMFENIDLPFVDGIDSRDWDSAVSVEERINNVMTLSKDGVIVLMHDFTDNDKTVEALPIIISKLRAEGYEFHTVSELFELKGINPHVKGKIWRYVE